MPIILELNLLTYSRWRRIVPAYYSLYQVMGTDSRPSRYSSDEA